MTGSKLTGKNVIMENNTIERDEVFSREIDRVVYSPHNTTIYKLGADSWALWNLIDGKRTIGDIIDQFEKDINRAITDTERSKILALFEKLKKGSAIRFAIK